MLHLRKKGSILQWYNTLNEGDVTSLEQFTDGSLFYNIVTSLNFTYSSEENDAKAKSSPTDSMEPMDVNVEQINTVNEETVETGQSVSRSAVSDSPEVEENGNIDSEKKYDSVKKCIDDIFQMDSTSLISYLECLKGNELELAKVAVFLLTALVQNLLSTNMESTKPLTQLDGQVQEDIQEFLSCVLTDRSQDDGLIKKSEFHKLLSRSVGTPHRRLHSQSSESIYHSETSDVGKNTSKKRKDRASSIVYEDNQDSPVKTLLESPKFQQKVAMYRKESELKKLRNALYMEENKVLDLVTEKNILNEKLEKKSKEVESLKNDFRKYREEAEDSECFKIKEVKKLEEEIECLKKINHSLKEENNKIKEENETYDKKLEELEMKLAEKKVPDCNDKSHITLSEELTIKDDELAHLKADVKKLEKKLQTLEETSNERNGLSSKVPKVFSNITNVNEVTTALLDKKEQEIKSLWTKLWDETEKTKNFQALLKFAEKEKMDQNEEINRNINLISVLESDQAHYRQQLDFFKENCTCLKNSRTNSNNSKEQEVSDLQLSSTNSREFLSEAENATSIAEELGLLQSNLNKDSKLSMKKSYVEFDSSMQVPNTDFVLLQKMIQNLVELIQRQNYGLDAQALDKLEKELSDTKCIQQLILAVNCIINALKLSRSNTPDRKSLDPQVRALTLEKKELEMETKSLKQELNDVNKFLEVKEVELQVVKNECEELQSLKKELNEKIDKVSKEAEEITKKYEGAKKCIEKKEIERRKLMKLYMRLTKSAEPDKSQSSCDECKKLQQKIIELQSECSDKEQVIQGLKSTKRNLECKIKNHVQQVKQLQHEKEELQFQHQRDISYSCGTLSDREKVMLCYYEKALAELDKKAKASGKTKKAQSWSTIPSVSANTYTMSGEKNSTVDSLSVANQSIRSSFFQVANEEDFLNHSSLTDIHNGGNTEGSNVDDRLTELRRRNTLCLPHLQSSYPLEIQNMTPSEKKYYEPPQQPLSMTFISEERELYRKQKEETDSANSRELFALNKRKMPDDDATNASKKIFRPSQKSVSSKSAASLKRGTSLLKKGTIRTPSSIRRFISMPHKNIKKY